MELATLLCDDFLLALVPVDEPTPKAAEVHINATDGEPVHLSSLNFVRQGGAQRELLTLLLIRGTQLENTRMDCVVFDSPAPRTIPLPPPTATPGHVIDAVNGSSPGRSDQILDFLMNEGWQRSATLRESPRAKRVFRSLLAASARHDGVIEILALLRGAGTFVQGWSRSLDASVQHVVLETENLAVEACTVASFERGDIAQEARGVVVLAAAWQSLQPSQIYRAYFRGKVGWFYLDVYDEARILEGRDALEHLRAITPRLSASERTIAALTRMTRASYERRNSLLELGLPVRLEIDRALATRAGVFLLRLDADPSALTQSVTLRSLSGFVARLDTRWARSRRPDVSEAFVSDPVFQGLLHANRDTHGFVVYLATEEALEVSEHLFLEIELRDGAVAFVPLAVRHDVAEPEIRDVLGGFDFRDASAGDQLEHHLAPFIKALCASTERNRDAVVAEVHGPVARAGDFTVLIPAVGELSRIEVSLAQLAAHGDVKGRQIIVVVSDERATELSARIARLADFYRLSIQQLRGEAPLDRVSALRLAAAHASTRWVLALGLDVYAQAARWMAGLSSAARGVPGAAFVSPSLLYEDGSIRFAGRPALEALARSEVLSAHPPTVLRSRFDGYPRAWIAHAQDERVAGGSLECCLMHRERFLQLSAPEPPYMNGDVKEAVFWQRAHDAGARVLWTPSVAMTALDEDGGDATAHWRVCARIVDRWNLSAELSDAGEENRIRNRLRGYGLMSSGKRRPRKVLIISHGHPSFSLGGAEVASHNLFTGLNQLQGVEAHYLARVDGSFERHSTSNLLSLRDSEREVLYHCSSYDHVRLSNHDTGAIKRDLLRYMEDLAPDVVHFHHFLGLGLECLYAVKRRFPSLALVVTFHEFLAICHQHGQMVKRDSHRLCYRASPAECAMCFPEIGRNEFYRRETFARSLLGLADRFVSPSRFLSQRYVEWGLPQERFAVIENGLADASPIPPRPLTASGRRNRFAFFGQVNPFKGLHVLMEAVARVPAEIWGDDAQVSVFGGGLENQPASFQERFHVLLERAGDRLRFFGRYDNTELPRLMASVDWVVVPSVWWENSPVVIQEAFLHGRPVIASNIGGMAEKVSAGVDGLDFRVGSAEDLADRLAQAITDETLWQRLRDGITPPMDAAACARKHIALYRSVLGEARRHSGIAVLSNATTAGRAGSRHGAGSMPVVNGSVP